MMPYFKVNAFSSTLEKLDLHRCRSRQAKFCADFPALLAVEQSNVGRGEMGEATSSSGLVMKTVLIHPDGTDS